MAESESNLLNVVVVGANSQNRRVKPTQVFSAAFVRDIVERAPDRAAMALAAILGPDTERARGDEPTYSSELSGSVFQSKITLDTTTTPGSISIVVDDAADDHVYGPNHGKFSGFVGRRDAAGNLIAQAPGYFEVDLTDGRLSNVPFAASTTEYAVGIAFATFPSVVTSNPRTGAFEYTEDETEFGVVFTPSVVTDLGGTIRLEFPADAYISSDSLAGRQAVVYLANGPQTDTASAIVTATVTFTAGTNRVEVGVLGQGAVSTVPGDYRVALLGPVVSDTGLAGAVPGWRGVALIGVINNAGTPNANFAISTQVVTGAHLASLISTQQNVQTTDAQRRVFKLDTKQYDFEDVPNRMQIGVTPRPANVKWGGTRSWTINEEGEQSQVTSKQDFLYIPDDSGTGAIQRDFKRYVTPLTDPAPLVDEGAAGVPGDLSVHANSAGSVPPYWSSNAVGTALRFLIPIRLTHVVVTDIKVHLTAGNVLDVPQLRIVKWSGTAISAVPVTPSMTVSASGTTTWFLSSPADFAEFAITDNSSLGTPDDQYFVEMTVTNNATPQSLQIHRVELSGRLLKNYPVSN